MSKGRSQTTAKAPLHLVPSKEVPQAITMTNRELLEAQGALQQLLAVKLPIRVSEHLALMISNLNIQLQVITELRRKLYEQYGIRSQDGRSYDPPENPDSLLQMEAEWNTLMASEHSFPIQKVLLPEKIASTCDACHHNMDRPLEIEPGVMLPLVKLVGVREVNNE